MSNEPPPGLDTSWAGLPMPPHVIIDCPGCGCGNPYIFDLEEVAKHVVGLSGDEEIDGRMYEVTYTLSIERVEIEPH